MKLIKFFINTLFFTSLLFSLFLFLSNFLPGPLPKTFLVSSGSMSPAISTGSLVIVLPQTTYKSGDIITFKTGKTTRTTTTHRLVAIGGGVVKTAGDANNAPDPELTPASNVLGKVVFAIPRVGYLAGFAQTPQGFILFVIVPATILIYEEIKSLIAEIRKKIISHADVKQIVSQPDAGKRQAARNAFANIRWPILTIPVIGLVLVFATISGSFFSDTEVSHANSFTAWVPTATPTPTTPPTPTPIPVAGDVVINEINWAGNNTNADDEWVELKNMTPHPINLTNWYIQGLGTSTSSGTITIGTIPAYGYFLISHYDKNTSHINIDPDFVFPSISLVNTGELLTLKSNTNITIDTANRVGAWYAGSNNSPKKSMERKDPPDDGTSNGKWKDSTAHTNMDGTTSTDEFGTPKAANSL